MRMRRCGSLALARTSGGSAANEADPFLSCRRMPRPVPGTGTSAMPCSPSTRSYSRYPRKVKWLSASQRSSAWVSAGARGPSVSSLSVSRSAASVIFG